MKTEGATKVCRITGNKPITGNTSTIFVYIDCFGRNKGNQTSLRVFEKKDAREITKRKEV